MPEHRPAVSRETAFPPPGRMSRELGAPPGPGSRLDGARLARLPTRSSLLGLPPVLSFSPFEIFY